MTDNRDSMIEKVRALWRLADHPNTGEHEKANAIAQAEKLMAKYEIDELILHHAEGSNAREDIVQLSIRITEDGRKILVKDQRVALVNVLAQHYSCRGIITTRHETVDMDDGQVIHGGTFFQCIGYKSDARMTATMYSSLVVDLMMALMEEPSQKENYQRQFALGFVERIYERLAAISRAVKQEAASTGMEIVLVGKTETVESYVDDKYPNLGTYRTGKTTHDPNARARGAKAADRADVGQTKMGGGEKNALNK